MNNVYNDNNKHIFEQLKEKEKKRYKRPKESDLSIFFNNSSS